MGTLNMGTQKRPPMRLTRAQRLELEACRPVDPSDIEACTADCLHFVDEHVDIYDETRREYIPFRLWPAQVELIRDVFAHGRVCVLKARQIGYTWVGLAIALWMVVFQPGCHIGLWSYTIEESRALMQKLKDMFAQLPAWMKQHLEEDVRTQARAQMSFWSFANATRVRAMSPARADSYQFTFCLVDEGPLFVQGRLKRLLTRLLPAVNSVDQGRVLVLGVANKLQPLHDFNELFRIGDRNRKQGPVAWDQWVSFFRSCFASALMSQSKYAEMVREELDAKGHLDDLHEQYPRTAEEALAPASSNKRLPQEWIMALHETRSPIPDAVDEIYDLPECGDLRAPQLLNIYHRPSPGRTYVTGIDAAEGLASSENSVVCVIEKETGVECALLAGKITPEDTAWDAAILSWYYYDASILTERNNHGHLVVSELNRLNAPLLLGRDGRWGWSNNGQTKIELYDTLAKFLRMAWKNNKSAEVYAQGGEGVTTLSEKRYLLHSSELVVELMNIERETLLAPEGLRDDRADAYATAVMARELDFGGIWQRNDWTRV